MPSAIHFGLRRAGKRGGCGVAAEQLRLAPSAVRDLLQRDVVSRGSMSMVIRFFPEADGFA